MRKNSLLFAGIISVLILSACGGKSTETTEGEVNKDSLYAEIKRMEKELFNEQLGIEENKAMDMIAKYNDFAATFPEDTNSAKFLYLAADIANAVNKPKIKVQNYKTILEKYPDFKGREHVIYLLAFTYDYDMNNREDAKIYYNMVLEEAKDTNFLRDARIRMGTIDCMTYQQYLDSVFNANKAIPVQ